MEVSNNSSIKSKLVETLINRDSKSFSKYLNEAISTVEKELLRDYSSSIRKQLNG